MSWRQHVITLDVDWASDPVIRHCADILTEHGVRATWLITHHSAEVARLADNPLFELGIHPNFHDGSSHGETHWEVLDHVLSLVPDAKTVRTHGLYQSTQLFQLMLAEYGIENDLSLLLRDAPHLEPHEFFVPEGVLRRFPSFWEDDEEMLCPEPQFSFADPKYHVDGLKVFTFHPILVALNAVRLDGYQALKASNDISTLELSDLEPHADSGAGAGSLFRDVAAHIAEHHAGGMTISELAAAWQLSRS